MTAPRSWCPPLPPSRSPGTPPSAHASTVEAAAGYGPPSHVPASPPSRAPRASETDRALFNGCDLGRRLAYRHAHGWQARVSKPGCRSPNLDGSGRTHQLPDFGSRGPGKPDRVGSEVRPGRQPPERRLLQSTERQRLRARCTHGTVTVDHQSRRVRRVGCRDWGVMTPGSVTAGRWVLETSGGESASRPKTVREPVGRPPAHTDAVSRALKNTTIRRAAVRAPTATLPPLNADRSAGAPSHAGVDPVRQAADPTGIARASSTPDDAFGKHSSRFGVWNNAAAGTYSLTARASTPAGHHDLGSVTVPVAAVTPRRADDLCLWRARPLVVGAWI